MKDSSPHPALLHRRLIDQVLLQIGRDIDIGDLSAVEELLGFIPAKNLIQYLPHEEDWKKYEELLLDNKK